MKDMTIAVDIAKDVFEIGVSNEPGKVDETHRVSRAKFLRFFANRESCRVVMEACGSAHHWAREIEKLGYRVVLLPPHTVRPYVQRSKTDRTDVKGILEASRNRDIKPVPVKDLSQQSITALHRFRSTWVATRTARLNMVRGLLRELGIFIPVGARNVVPKVSELVEDADSPLPLAVRESFHQTCIEIRELDKRISQMNWQLELLCRQIPACTRLRTIPGVGVLTATALVAFIGDVQRFRSCRQFASFLGLTPREYSSGNIRRLGRISKQGDSYLRTLLTHGARAVLWDADKTNPPDRLRAWALKVAAQRGHNKGVTAIANKLARISWAVLKYETEFKSFPQAA